MIHLIYVSTATREMSDEDLLFLLEQSRSRNQKQHITGMLLYLNLTFIQVLEGAEKDVDEIYEAIVKDDRNTGNIIIERAEIRERTFPDWTMGFWRLTQDNSSEIAGFTEFLDREMTPEKIANQSNKAINLLYNFKEHNT
jgi:Mg2+ and Co2+ transporter CorA